MSRFTLDIQNLRTERHFLWRHKQTLNSIVFLLITLSVVFIISWMIIWIQQDIQRFPWLKLVVTGEHLYTRTEDICQLILTLVKPNESIMMQDINIQNQIKRCFPWIKQVSIRKKWPNELTIHLIEYVPIAHWNGQNMVDIDGNIFNLPTDLLKTHDFPVLYSPERSKKEALLVFQEIRKILDEKTFILKSLMMTERCSWRLILTDNVKINLGRTEIMRRLMRLTKLYPVLLQEASIFGKKINYIDLRYDSGAAVCWTLKS